MPELYVATPPLECLRAIVASTMNSGIAEAEDEDATQLMVYDVSRAYFYAPALRPVYVKIADGDWESGDESRCGRLNVSMYGARDAALNWHHHCTAHLKKLGFEQGTSSSCLFYSKGGHAHVYPWR